MIWVVVVLIFGGMITGFAGHVWEKTAALLRFFGKDVNEEAGFKVMMGGLAAMAAGIGLLYLTK